MTKSSRKHSQNIHNTSQTHLENIPKTSRKHHQIIQKAVPKHPENMSESSRMYYTVVSYSYVSDSCVHYSCAYNCSGYSEAIAMYAALRPNTPGQLKVQWSSIAMSARNYISSKFKGQISLCPPETISAQSSKDTSTQIYMVLFW